MKKLILVFTAIAIMAGAHAQADSTNKKKSPADINYGIDQNLDLNNNQNQNMQNNSNSDGVMMENGKMMMVKNGKTTILDHDMTMSNGTKIMSDGTYTKKDGTKLTMKEGQRMDMSGKLDPTKTNKDKNMYLLRDSTRK